MRLQILLDGGAILSIDHGVEIVDDRPTILVNDLKDQDRLDLVVRAFAHATTIVEKRGHLPLPVVLQMDILERATILPLCNRVVVEGIAGRLAFGRVEGRIFRCSLESFNEILAEQSLQPIYAEDVFGRLVDRVVPTAGRRLDDFPDRSLHVGCRGTRRDRYEKQAKEEGYRQGLHGRLRRI